MIKLTHRQVLYVPPGDPPVVSDAHSPVIAVKHPVRIDGINVPGMMIKMYRLSRAFVKGQSTVLTHVDT